MYKKLVRANNLLPELSRSNLDPKHTLKDWLELTAEGLMFPQTVSAIGKRPNCSPYRQGISRPRYSDHTLLRSEALRFHVGSAAPSGASAAAAGLQPPRRSDTRARAARPTKQPDGRRRNRKGPGSNPKSGPNSVRAVQDSLEDLSYRFSHLGKHTMKVYDGPNGLDPKKNHNCQLCHEGGTDRVQKNRRRKAADVFCIYCQRSLCLQCWPKWHEE
jgi:hypothetical protein